VLHQVFIKFSSILDLITKQYYEYFIINSYFYFYFILERIIRTLSAMFCKSCFLNVFRRVSRVGVSKQPSINVVK